MTDIQPFSAIEPVDLNQPSPAQVYLKSLTSDNSKRVMQIALRNIIQIAHDLGTLNPDAEFVYPWWSLTYAYTQAIRAKLINAYQPSTANRHLAALRGVLKECWRLGLMSIEDYNRAADLKNIKSETLPVGRHISDREIRKLLTDCLDDDDMIGYRDRAILALLFTSGMRREELSGLDLSDYDPETDAIKIRRGKGRKQRVVYAMNKTRNVLQEWLELRGSAPGPLFCSIRRGDHLQLNHPYPAQSLWEMVVSRAAYIGIPYITPHDFRRTFVSNMLAAGVDPVLVASLTGHASVEMVKRYDRRKEAAKREAVMKIDLP